MDVRTCKMCGKLYNYISGMLPICQACSQSLEEKFAQVKSYIYDNPHASIQQVAAENEVPIKQIKQWIKDERLSFSEESAIGVECESCGVMIKTGRFCVNCKAEMQNSFSNAIKKKEVPKVEKKVDGGQKMRFLGN